MRQMKRIITILLSLLLASFLTACGGQTGLQDGYYTWDNAYMQTMLHENGTYPNEYTRYYAGQLLDGQGEGSIDALTGATSSHGTFQVLAQAVLEQARQGDSSIVFVNTAH